MPGSVKVPADGGGRRQTQRILQWAKAKFTLRLIAIAASLVATIVSLAWIGAPKIDGGWVPLSPLYALPYVIFSLVWEAIEILTIRAKSRSIQPVAHLVCELFLWLGGLTCAIIWIALTASYQKDSYFEGGGSPLTQDVFNKWADLIYFWSTVVLLMVICQFVLFVFACIEVDRKRRSLENNVNQIMQMIGDREQKPEDIIASLRLAELDHTKATWPIEMPAMNTDPVEMHVEERPLEMFGDLGVVRQTPARPW